MGAAQCAYRCRKGNDLFVFILIIFQNRRAETEKRKEPAVATLSGLFVDKMIVKKAKSQSA